MRIVFGVIGLLLLLMVAFFFSQSYFGFFGNKTTATIRDHTFSIDIAKTAKDKELGLSIKKNISDTYGMYFPFDRPDYYAFWMKQMKFPIDIIFIREGKIVTIFKNVPVPPDTDNLPTYQPDEPANAVLEINAGLSQKYGFIKGDSVTFKNLPK